MLTLQPVHGTCDVIVFHARHNLTLAQLDPSDIERVIDEWIRIYRMRGEQDGVKYVQIFEVRFHSIHIQPFDLIQYWQNKGAMMGCSNSHPHGQVWSLSAIPSIPSKELDSLRRYSLQQDISSSEAPRGPQGRQAFLVKDSGLTQYD